MKFKLLSLYIALFWCAVFLLGLWVFTVMFRASPVPEFGTGLIGGVVYALVMRALAGTAIDSAKDFLTEWRSVADVEAGRTTPIEQVRWETRERERIRNEEVCSDKSHWTKPTRNE